MASQAVKPVELTSMNLCGIWIYNTTSDDCAICKSKMVQCCTECDSSHVKGDLICEPSRGSCGHAFHKHCIDKWVSKSSVCPICNTPYNTSVRNMANDEDWKKMINQKVSK